MLNTKISIVIPTMNEEKYIKKCIDSLEASNYPKDSLELILVDGGSTDKTIRIAKELILIHKNIRLISQPGVNTSAGRNIAINNATGIMIFNFSSHAIVERDTLSILATELSNCSDDVMGVGCKDKIPKDQISKISVGIDSITQTLLGGRLMHQQAPLKKAQYYDSISFTLYRKEAFERIGLFSENLPYGDDAEFNYRLKKAGYKLLYTPNTNVYRYRRQNIKGFYKQMFNYGKARMQILKIHNNSVRFTYILPIIFIIYIFLGLPLLFFHNDILLVLWGTGISLYLLSLLAFSAKISLSQKAFSFLLICPILYIAEHLAYSLGTLSGFFQGNKNKELKK